MGPNQGVCGEKEEECRGGKMKDSEKWRLRRRRERTVIRSHISAIKRKTEDRSQRSGE